MKEPSWEVLEEYFKEVIEGRSINSVLRVLRKEGYQISEGTLRARYKEWLAYQKAKEEFEIKLNQLKGEILEKINDKVEELREAHSKQLIGAVFRSLNNTKALEKLLGKKTYQDITSPLEKYEDGLLWNIVDDIEKAIDSLQNQLETLAQENKRLHEQVHLLANALWAVLSGIYYKDKKSGLLERKDLWDHVSEGLTQEDINKVSRLAKNS